MEDISYQNVREIREVRVSFYDGQGEKSPIVQVNRLLKEGWVLLAVHKRGRAYPEDGGHEDHETIYILGRTS